MLSDTSSEMGSSNSGSNGSVAILDVQNALKVLEKNCTNSDKVPSIYYVITFRGERGKEGCNWGHGLSAAIKPGSLEKTVGASVTALWCVLNSPFFVVKNKLHHLLPS